MNDHHLVAALRAREPGAPDAVYAAYADRLYAYCWFRLRGRDAAQVALRDTFIVAEAHIDRLRDPARFGPWLYAIARLECARRPVATDRAPDIAVARHDQDDVDRRITAWQAVLGMPAAGREILDLWVRHGLPVPELAAVLGLTVRETQAALEEAHTGLEAALTSELLAVQGPYGCLERGVLLRERRGGPCPESSARLLRHARMCPECGPFRPDPVSPAKVYGLLPQAVPPDALRARVVACFMDPELVGYRLFVATRLSAFRPDGFPAMPRRAEFTWRGRKDSHRHGAATVRLGVALSVSVLLMGGAGAVHLTGQQSKDGGPVSDNQRRPSVPPSVAPPAHAGERTVESQATVPVSAIYPLGATNSAAPPTALSSPPPRRDYQSAPGESPVAPLPSGVSPTNPPPGASPTERPTTPRPPTEQPTTSQPPTSQPPSPSTPPGSSEPPSSPPPPSSEPPPPSEPPPSSEPPVDPSPNDPPSGPSPSRTSPGASGGPPADRHDPEPPGPGG
ncbi:RNA polymerase sigma factor [Actinomadura hibisca]|uniref:RNA polymerase sigma factor n=1 Tax=Actinomadura hibisca TaxID=68565 RepID=UPI000831ED32|nr:sigma-70 family RNA polymerase sigma factor [Actinomadura hibisca]